jgi:starch phosphorylase
MSPAGALVRNRHIAYFSMEIALRPEIHSNAGGLGVLAGDTARACAALELPLVFVTLVRRDGYVAQEIDAQGRQIDGPDPWHPEQWMSPLMAKVALPIEGRDVWVRAWLYAVEGPSHYAVPVIMLDTDLEENASEDRQITQRLYGGDQAYRLRQDRARHRRGEDLDGAGLQDSHLSPEREPRGPALRRAAADPSPVDRSPFARRVERLGTGALQRLPL